MVAVLKTAEAKVSGGSNPSLSDRNKMERCERGRIGLPAKELTWQTRVRGFESPPLRFFSAIDQRGEDCYLLMFFHCDKLTTAEFMRL